MNGFTKIKNNLIVSNLNHIDFRVLCYLIARSKNGKCFPSVGTIAKEINVSKRTILRAIDNLVKDKYIVREQRTIGTGKITSNLYTINKDYLTKQNNEEVLHETQVQKELIDYDWLNEEE